MSLFLLFFVIVYFGGLFLAVVHPMYPLVSYLAFYYMPPHVNWWGRYLPNTRYSMIAAAVLAVSVAICWSRLERQSEERNPALPWLLLFGANTIAVTTWALNSYRSWGWSAAFLKLIVIYMLIPVAVRTPAQFDAFGMAHVVGATYWGYKAWDNPKRKAGRLEQVGGPDTQNDNQAAGHLLTVIPFVALYVLTEKRKFRRGVALVGGAFIVNTLILCNSRGATLGLLTAGLSAIAFAGRGRRARLAGVAIAGAIGVLLLADPQFIARQQTSTNPQDASAQSRLVSWIAGMRMVRDHPAGAGGRAFHLLSPKYIPAIVEAHYGEERSAHNTYVQLATEWGVQGTILYAIFFVATFRLLRDIKRRAVDDPYYFNRAMVLQAAIVGTMTAATFSNRLYGESIYWMCALAFALHRMQTTELAAREVPVVDAEVVAERGALPAPAAAHALRAGS